MLNRLCSKINYFSFSVETITIGDKKIGIRTSVLEEKATACNMLCCYADELKEGFYPWVDQVRVLPIGLTLLADILYFQLIQVSRIV